MTKRRALAYSIAFLAVAFLNGVVAIDGLSPLRNRIVAILFTAFSAACAGFYYSKFNGANGTGR